MAIVITVGQQKGGTGKTTLAANIAADLATRHLPLLRSALGNRAGFAHAFAAGLGVTEAAPRSTAAAELRALLAELQEFTE